MERYICIHGHFYQPPRENPWLEALELQDSAYPFHDWNERISAECYAPNSAARILSADGCINEIVNNYSQISFNFGPTLLAWMKDKEPEVYRAVLAADRESRGRFSRHGSAIAQAYNHMILPLANSRDKYTQVVWGIHDFEFRFERRPEGMWLPETAVDLETLDFLAEQGIKYTVLSPYQASRVRKKGDKEWRNVEGGQIDPTTAYEQKLPSGRKISLFFYDGPISRGIAFEGMLRNGENFANRLAGAFSEARPWPQLVHIATDGETYGHHHKQGDMALAYALHHIKANNLARLTNYGEYLALNRPTHEVQVTENTAWSCVHGVGRWMADCGCNSGGHPEWNQSWRAPLRSALDWLRDTLAPLFEEKAKELVKDPWAARNDYIMVILDRSPEVVDAYLARHATHPLNDQEISVLLKLMELQRHAMLMYTSCGWFFDELSGIETVQVIMYAGRAVQLAQELFKDGIEESFLQRLAEAKSNIPEHMDGRHIYEKWVKPAMVDLPKVGAHYALSSLFENYPEQAEIFAFGVQKEAYQSMQVGRTRLATGRIRVASKITRESADLTMAVLHFGDHNLSSGIRYFQDEEAFHAMVKETSEAFDRADLPQVMRVLDRHFEQMIYSPRSLFRDEQRKIANLILEPALADAKTLYRDIYERQVPLMLFLTDLGIPLPSGFNAAAEVTLNTRLQEALQGDDIALQEIYGLLKEAQRTGVTLNNTDLSYALKKTLERRAEAFVATPDDIDALKCFAVAAELSRELPFTVDIWRTQNIYWNALGLIYPRIKAKADEGDDAASEWVRIFAGIGDKLWIAVAGQ